MKTKAKLTLAISVLSAVVLSAGVTSTFAWFTTQSKATLSTGDMTVSTVSEIKITVTKLGYETGESGTKAIGEAGTTMAADSGVTLGPVSSADGFNFYAPTSLKNTYVDTDMAAVGVRKDWTLTRSNEYVGYVKYGIHVEKAKDNGAARTLKYKVNASTSGAKASDLAESYRVALRESTEEYVVGTKVAYLAETAYHATTNPIISWTPGSTSGNSLTTGAFEATAISDSAVSLGKTTATVIDAYYVFSVWLEGCAEKANNDLAGSKLAVDLEFSLE